MTKASPLLYAIQVIARRGELSSDEIEQAFEMILSGSAEPERIGAFLMGLAVRGETGNELYAGAKALRANAREVNIDGPLLDTCGTGGLGWTSLNTSTASALVVAASGGRVAKHGNRSVPPKTGSADVLEALGVNIDLDGTGFARCVDQANVGFLFARTHHSAMRHVAPIRASLGIRTIFNLLGPLSNPANASHQILGVSDKKWMYPMAEALQKLGIEHAWIVHGVDATGQSIDELSIAGPSFVLDVTPTAISETVVDPSDAGLQCSPLVSLTGGAPVENAQAIRDLLDGRDGPFRDAVILNAAAGLFLLERTPDLKSGAEIAGRAIDSGRARQTLETLVAVSGGPAT